MGTMTDCGIASFGVVGRTRWDVVQIATFPLPHTERSLQPYLLTTITS